MKGQKNSARVGPGTNSETQAAACNLRPKNTTPRAKSQQIDFVNNRNFRPAYSVKLGDTVYSRPDAGGNRFACVSGLCAFVDGPLVHLSGFHSTPGGKYCWWECTHSGPYTVVWDVGPAVSL